jgi:hypothetical protein
MSPSHRQRFLTLLCHLPGTGLIEKLDHFDRLRNGQVKKLDAVIRCAINVYG